MAQFNAISPPAENKDAVEGETIRLACRFNPSLLQDKEVVYYWQRHNKNGQDVQAVNEKTFEPDYKLEYIPHEGKYDLIISAASYDRDNGNFLCKIKKHGKEMELNSVNYLVTILSKHTIIYV